MQAEMAERVGGGLSDEEPALCAWDRAAEVNGASGAARPRQFAGEVDLLVDRRPVRAEVERRAGADVER